MDVLELKYHNTKGEKYIIECTVEEKCMQLKKMFGVPFTTKIILRLGYVTLRYLYHRYAPLCCVTLRYVTLRYVVRIMYTAYLSLVVFVSFPSSFLS